MLFEDTCTAGINLGGELGCVEQALSARCVHRAVSIKTAAHKQARPIFSAFFCFVDQLGLAFHPRQGHHSHTTASCLQRLTPSAAANTNRMRIFALYNILPFSLPLFVLGVPLTKRTETPWVQFTYAGDYYKAERPQRQAVAEAHITQALTLLRSATNPPFPARVSVLVEAGVHASMYQGGDTVPHLTFYFSAPDVCGTDLCVGHAYVFDDAAARAQLAGSAVAEAERAEAARALAFRGVVCGHGQRIWGVRPHSQTGRNRHAKLSLCSTKRLPFSQGTPWPQTSSLSV